MVIATLINKSVTQQQQVADCIYHESAHGRENSNHPKFLGTNINSQSIVNSVEGTIHVIKEVVRPQVSIDL